MQPLLAHMYGPVHAQELLPGRAGMISILFFGTASDVADLVAVLLGYLEQIPAKLHDFADKDLLQHIDLARFLFGKVIPPCREAR